MLSESNMRGIYSGQGKSLINEMKELIKELNKASDYYYNTDKTIMSDKEWDDKYNQLLDLEYTTEIILSNSPTQSVGYEVKDKLNKVQHEFPLKSLNKAHTIEEIKEFQGNKKCVAMLKEDGLTTDITYDNGILIQAETRGNGEIGEDITHNVRTYINLPKTIPYKGKVHIVGESVITYDDFQEINKNNEYKNPRNLVSGSVRQLDSNICAKRKVKFIAYNVLGKDIITKEYELQWLRNQGFEVVKYIVVKDIQEDIKKLQNKAKEIFMPIDGIVFTYNDKKYGESLGVTGHHPKHSLAYKFYDEEEETILRDVKWQVGRTGVITPVAIFDTVELEGTEVSKASIHNLSIIENLKLGIGDNITVFKANQIIPQIRKNKTQSNTLKIPKECPICKSKTTIKESDNAKFLICENINCKAQLTQRIKHYCSREAMNIEGLSEKTIEKFIEQGYLNSIEDIYDLKNKTGIKNIEGFGEKSFNKLIDNIEKSKKCKLENFIYALGISNVGKSTSKILVEYTKGKNAIDTIMKIKNMNTFDLINMKDCGEVVAANIYDWFNNSKNHGLLLNLLHIVNFIEEEKISIEVKDNILKGKTVYPTGKFALKKSDLKLKLEELGAIISSGYKKSLDYLIVGGDISKSGKVDKAKKDNVKLLSEKELMGILEG